jgi:hypothetical protein
MNKKINPKCHIGETHGIYTIIDVLEEKDKYSHYVYKCVCNKCGRIKYSHYGAIAGEKSIIKNCTHLRANGDQLIHTYWKNRRIGNIYKDIMTRCYNKNDKNYKYYGLKGIILCDEWLNNPKSFEEWALNNGYQDDLTIDRINPSKNYSPENCRWITMEENARRAGKVNWITVNDETLTGRQWSERLGLGITTINKILKENGLNKTIELIQAMLKESPSTKHRKSHQTWLNVYGVDT